MKASLQANVAHRRHNVLPVPVGLSSNAFSPLNGELKEIERNRLILNLTCIFF